MTGAVLRGSRASGYRTTAPLECPHCHQPFDCAGSAAQDQQGPYLTLWPVQPRPGEYSAADLALIYHGPKPTAAELGLSLPHAPGRIVLTDDPVPRFDGSGR